MMNPGPLHWALAASVAIAAHLAAFYSSNAQGWQAAGQAGGAPQAVWGLTEIALTEEIDPTKTQIQTPQEAVEKSDVIEPEQARELSAVAPVEQAEIAAPEAVEPVEQKVSELKPVEEPKKKKAEEKRKRDAASSPVGRSSPGSNRQSRSSGAAFSSYAGRIAAHLRRYKRYPNSAGRARGTARVAFSVSRGGSLTRVRLVASSGNAALDRAAVEMVRRASPFPAIPAGVNRSSASFAVPIRFQR